MGFGTLDYLVIVAYLALMGGVGVYFMRAQADENDYFLGSRGFHWLPVAASMFAAVFSAISYISAPAEAYNHGVTLFLKSCLILLGLPPAILIFVRFFRKLDLNTAYEYLERRFDLRVRVLASALFILLRFSYLGVVLFATAIALEPATGLPPWASIVLVGVVSTAYTTLGGIKSVIWADAIQFVIMFGGTMWILGVLIADNSAGIVGIWQHAQASGHTFVGPKNGDFYSFSPFVRLSLWGMVASAVFDKLGAAGTDQVTVQRYLSTRDPAGAVRSMAWGTLIGIPMMGMLYLTGLGLLSFYHHHPERAMHGMTGDQALACFIASELPPGIGGIIMAAILAAALSTVDSCLNSLSACTITDFWKRLWRPTASGAAQVRVARIVTFAWGVGSILSAMAMIWLFGQDRTQTPLIVVTTVTIGFFTGVLLGVFLLGVLTRRANSVGVLIGAACGLAAALAVTAPYYFVKQPPTERLSFLWINIIGCLVTLTIGYMASVLRPAPTRPSEGPLTCWD